MKLFASLLMTLPSLAFAAGGFTWTSGIASALHLPEHVVLFGFVSVLFILVGLLYRFKTADVSAALVPDSKFTFRNLFEFVGEFVYGLTRNIMGDKMAKEYFPLIVMLFMFILMSNVLGLIPGFLPPTDNFNTTLALGLFVFIYYNWHGIRVQGLVGHIKHFMGPAWYLAPLMLIIELISHGVRPISLGLRLKGNMEGDHLVLTIFSDLVPYLVPIPFYVIGLFVCFMQAFVFTLLTIVYISLACEVHDHEHHD